MTRIEVPVGNALPELVSQHFFWKAIGFETLTDSLKSGYMFKENYNVSLYAIALYFVFVVYLGPRIMKNREPFHLRVPLALWNFFLSIFSLLGFIRVVPTFVGIISAGLTYSQCYMPSSSFFIESPGFWGTLFTVSKFFELIDTMFMVLKKKKIPFLHWYHHMTVLWFAWDASVHQEPIAVYFCVMNYFVHAIMYFYYFLTSLGWRPKWDFTVTFLQIAQMLGGCASVIHGLYTVNHYGDLRVDLYPLSDSDFLNAKLPVPSSSLDTLLPHKFLEKSIVENDTLFFQQDRYLTAFGCAGSKKYLLAGVWIYGSYLVLFVQFFIRRYCKHEKLELGDGKRVKKD